MSISTHAGSTYVAPTGGAVFVYSQNAKPVKTGQSYANSAEADFFAREELILRAQYATLQNSGSYSHSRRFLLLNLPYIDSLDGVTLRRAQFKCESNVHPSVTAADLEQLRCQASELVGGAVLNDFWTAGQTDF